MSRKVILILTAVLGLAMTSCHTSKKGMTALSKSGTQIEVGVSRPYSNPQSGVRTNSSMSDATRRLLNEANGWLGTPYKYGGNSKSGVDCSGMVCMVFNNALNIKLPRSSAQQGDWCTKIKKTDLQPGDLLFFTTRSGSSAISHVGMYIGDGNMIHASTSKGVIISSLSEAYYVKTYHSSGRVAQYYAMVSKSGSSSKSPNTQPSTPSKPTQPKTTPSKPSPAPAPKVDKPKKVEEILLAGGKNGKEKAKEVAATVAKRTVDKATAKIVAVTPGESTRAALEKQRRQLLDEVVEQKIDSIVSDFFD